MRWSDDAKLFAVLHAKLKLINTDYLPRQLHRYSADVI